MPHNAPPQDATTGAVSAGQTSGCLRARNQHMPGDAGDASPETTEESKGEEQPAQPASPQDEDDPMEGSAASGQESPGTTSVGGNPPSDRRK